MLGIFLFLSSLEIYLDLLIDGSTKNDFTVGTVQVLGLVSMDLLIIEKVLGIFVCGDLTSSEMPSSERNLDFLIDGSVKTELTAGTIQVFGLVLVAVSEADKVLLRDMQEVDAEALFKSQFFKGGEVGVGLHGLILLPMVSSSSSPMLINR